MFELDAFTSKKINASIPRDKNKIIKDAFVGPMKWEQYRDERNKYFIETNKLLVVLDCATNYSLHLSQDEARLVEDNCTDGMIKEALGGLNHAISSMLTAMNCIEKHKSKAIDDSIDKRQAKFLTSKTANNFQGRTEYELREMKTSLLGMKFYFSSESFHHVFL